ncbi:MAG: nitrogenase molybdenum-iron protein subunit beta [Nitrospirae bacterium]|nr:nitrogenase molybdenum-iron protein subunit beta [Nitrospirota bacterium]
MNTAEWINTVEYKELNFARKALVVNPTKACQPLGAFFCASGFEGTLPYEHGSQGCTAYFRNNLARHYREPFPAVSDSMTEDAAVFGGRANMIEGLKNANDLYKPKMIAMCTSCMAEVIGDDLKAFISNARDAGSIPASLPVAPAHTPSFIGSHITGYDNMLLAIVKTLSEGKYKDGDRNGKLNVIPGFDAHIENIREVKRYMSMMGVPVTVLADNTETFDSPLSGHYEMYHGGTTLAEAGDSVNAIGTISMQAYASAKTVKEFGAEYGQKTAEFNYPMGIAAFDSFLMKVSEMTGMPIPASITDERGRALDAATDAHQYFHGKRFSMFGDPDVMLGLARFIMEMGGEPVHIVSTNGTKKWEREMQALLASSPYGSSGTAYPGKDLWHLRSLLVTEPVDMLIGDSHGKYAAKDAGIPLVRIGFPITDRVNLHRYATLGYKGTMNLITWITNAFLDELDRTCDDAHFELLR